MLKACFNTARRILCVWDNREKLLLVHDETWLKKTSHYLNDLRLFACYCICLRLYFSKLIPLQLKETLEQSIGQLKSQRLTRNSGMRSASLSSLYPSDLDGETVSGKILKVLECA